ncbi:MAG: hypothetical protein E7612_06080 [Ruminococcaceae bacterium]|nr:hypothetical protein [Oscillospiraceae bacterium]
MKKFISVILATMVLTAMLTVSAFAYNMGTVAVYPNGDSTQAFIGRGSLWTGNPNLGDVLYASVTSENNVAYDTVSVAVAYTFFDITADIPGYYQSPWKSTAKANAKTAEVSVEVADGRVGDDGRGRYALDGNYAQMCRDYNYGNGMGACRNGENCAYN